MKAFLSVTKRFFAEIWSDSMLAVLPFVPVFMGIVFRFGVPVLESYLCKRLEQAAILTPYYFLFDLLLSIMTPLMFTAAGAMVILDEADLGLARAVAVTPVGRRGYLASRIGVPAMISTVYCVVISLVFRLSDIDIPRLLLLALCSGVLSITAALMIVSMAKNKVEGMAYTKLTGLLVAGLPSALLVPSPYKYIAASLPSFWMTEIAMDKNLWLTIPAVLTGVLLSLLFVRRFMKKILS